MRELKELEQITGKKIIFTEYYSWFKAIKDSYNTISYLDTNDQNLKLPQTIYWLLNYTKGTKHLRVIFDKGASRQDSIGHVKWCVELNIGKEIQWSKLYTMAKKCNLNARLRYFNFQILHRSLMKNKKN